MRINENVHHLEGIFKLPILKQLGLIALAEAKVILQMIKKISDIARGYPFSCLFGMAILVNVYIQGMYWSINGILDPMARQFEQNIFICLLCAVVAIAAIAFIFICKIPSPTFNPAELTEKERALRNLLFNVIVPLLMTAVVIGDLAVVISLKW